MTGPPSEPETVNAETMTNLSSANINKLQTNKEKLSIELQKKISNFTEQTKTMGMVEANIQDTKNKLTELTAERNAALNGLAKYSKKLAEVMKSKQANENTIKNLENKLTELQGISNATKKELSAQINKLKKLNQTPIKPVQNTGKNIFRKKVQATISSDVVSNTNKVVLQGIINRINTNNLITLEQNYADLIGKPRIYLFLNEFDGKNLPNYAKREGIQTLTAGKTNVTNAVNKIKEIVNDYTSIKPKKNLNMFFIGPSGSGKTFLFNKYLGKNVAGNVTAYYPTFNYNLKSGILTISDTSKKMPYSTFVKDFIRPTPFNKTSSRAHMSYQNGDVTVFDLAGTENPMAIMEEALGYNIFETKYWEKFSSASVKSHTLKGGSLGEEVKQLLAALELPLNGVGLSGLDEMVFLYVYWNYIHPDTKFLEKIANFAKSIVRIRKAKTSETKIKMMVGVFNDIKRVFEGFWITRSLHALNLLFTNNSYKNLVKKTNTTVTGSNIARSNVTGSKGAFEIELKRRVVKGGITRYETSNFVQKLGSIKRAQDARFVILNKTNPSYETNFVAGLKQSDSRNCLIGVVNAQSKFPEQRLAAIEYLESLQK